MSAKKAQSKAEPKPEAVEAKAARAPLSFDDIPETGDAGESPAEEEDEAVTNLPPGRSKSPHRLAGKPNFPSFAWDPKDKQKPVLEPGDEVTEELERNGVKVTRTKYGALIYHCTLNEYESKIRALGERPLFEAWFPHAK